MDLCLHRLDEQQCRQRRVGAADLQTAQMEFHFAGQRLFELPQARDAFERAGRMIEQQPVHIRLRGVQLRHRDDQLPDGFGQRRFLGAQALSRLEQCLCGLAQMTFGERVEERVLVGDVVIERFTACPVWLVHPGADRWTPLSLSQAFFDRIAAPKRLVVLEAAGHYPVETPGIHQLADAFIEIREQSASRPASPGR
nr:alpha/beta hydrolase [Nocardia abscessus]